ncbi:MAG: divalent metal cation transporter [Gammaproteobacteria bacterium]|nr:divalent metal cation transporter [Gammaproteobacteria bacterium]
MLADTDAGSLITAAQSGALFGYKLLLAQLILIPILYICQELTVRLGITTGMGHGELIRHHFGKAWAWLSVSTLIVACIGAILSEYSGLTGVGLMFGVPSWTTLTLTVIFLVVMVLTGSYRSIERIIVAIGLFELVFIYVAWKSHPSLKPIMQQLFQMPFRNGVYLYLMAGNIGAVIMPWMIFYQQSAVVDKKLTVKELNPARWDTAIGAIITQIIMASVLMAVAATVGTTHPNTPLDTVQQISHALTPFLGENVGRILFAIGMIGASLAAAIVVSLTAAWALGEVTGYKHSLEHHPREAPWFYTTYTITLILGALFVGSGINLVKISVAVNVMNALLLPIVLGFLFLLAIKTLPEKYRLRGWYKYFTAAIIAITSIFGLIAGLWGIFY